jgi:hypothetical protein
LGGREAGIVVANEEVNDGGLGGQWSGQGLIEGSIDVEERR